MDLHECVSLLFPQQVDAREEVAAQLVAQNLRKKGVASKSLAEASTDIMGAVMKIANVVFDREIRLQKVRLFDSLLPHFDPPRIPLSFLRQELTTPCFGSIFFDTLGLFLVPDCERIAIFHVLGGCLPFSFRGRP